MDGVQSEEMPASFGQLLARARRAAGLTQEELAERAGVSWRAVSDLERGARLAPRRDTLALLAEALALTGKDRGTFERAARRSLSPPATTAPVPAASANGQPTTRAVRHNLPAILSTLIGRDADQDHVRALLASGRLVTLTGIGGVGKTRLALAVASSMVGAYPDGIWLLELAALADAALVPGAVAQVLDVREGANTSFLESLVTALRDRQLLLVLDNCEHLVDACARLADTLVRACPRLRLLATSREALGVAGELSWRVPPLSLPERTQDLPLDELARTESVTLFIERVQAQRPSFALTAANAPAVTRICRQLDGIPLAIELAAARVGTLAVEEVASRLGDGFRLLTGGPRTALPRQRTLQAALDWSYDLLDEAERAMLRRLSVFVGGWTLAAAEVVCAGDPVDAWAVLDLLDGLVRKSLVPLEDLPAPGYPESSRYHLLETVRQYGRERLLACGEAVQVAQRHRAWCLALAEEAEPALHGSEQVLWLERLETEHHNLRAALAWTDAENEDGEARLRLAAGLWRFWVIRGHLSEGRQRMAQALSGDTGRVPSVRGRALTGAGNLAMQQGDFGSATALYEECLSLWRELGDTAGIATILNNLGNVAKERGDVGRAMALYEESLKARRALGDMQGIAASLNNLGLLAQEQCDYGRARALHEESLALWRELGSTQGLAYSLNNLGIVLQEEGDYPHAKALHEESLALKRALSDTWGIASSLNNLGIVARELGDYERARTLHRESLGLCQILGETWLVVFGLEGLAYLAALQGQAAQGAAVLGLVESLREASNTPRSPAAGIEYARAVAAMRGSLGEAAFAAAWAAGRSLSLEKAIALALEGGSGG